MLPRQDPKGETDPAEKRGGPRKKGVHVRVFDITSPIDEQTPVYPGDPRPTLTFTARLEDGAVAALSCLSLSSHTGTHIDAPAHFVPGGARVGDLPVDHFCGPCEVVDLSHVATGDIEARHLQGRAEGARIVLLKTRNGALWGRGGFQKDFCALSLSAATRLAELGVGVVGIDYLSIEGPGNPTYAVHRRLLGAGIGVIEGLRLEAVAGGSYRLTCLPLRVPCAEAAPARAFLTAD